MRYLLLCLGLILFTNIASAASFEDELEQKQKTSEQQISEIGKQISSRSLLQCSKLAPRIECFLKVIRQKTLTAPYEYTGYAQQVIDLVKADVADGKLSKSESLLSLSDGLLTLVEKVDLNTGWLFTYKTSASNAAKVSFLKSNYRDLMEKAKEQVINNVTDNLVLWGQLNVNKEIPPRERQQQLEKMSQVLKRKVALEKMRFN